MKPRDKAKVEVAVQVATRWIIAKLRNARLFSLAKLNEAIRDCVKCALMSLHSFVNALIGKW